MIDRTIRITPINDESIALSGYVYDYGENPIPPPNPFFYERIPRETFEAALRQNPNAALRFNYTGDEIANTADGSLLLLAEDTGLHIDAIVDKRHENDLHDRIFALSFDTHGEEWTYDERNHRLITQLVLRDIGVIQKVPDQQ